MDVDFMTSRAILAPTNDEFDNINDLTSNFFPGESKTYLTTVYVTCEKPKNFFLELFKNSFIKKVV